MVTQMQRRAKRRTPPSATVDSNGWPLCEPPVLPPAITLSVEEQETRVKANREYEELQAVIDQGRGLALDEAERDSLAETDLDLRPYMLPRKIDIAVDTEYFGTHTLLVQCAARLNPKTVVIQLYRSPFVPELPADFDLQQYAPLNIDNYGSFYERYILRPVKVLPTTLSPAQMALDLYGISGPEVLSRVWWERLRNGRSPWDGSEEPVKGQAVEAEPDCATWERTVQLTLIAHFWRADFCRIFGRQTFRDLQASGPETALMLREQKLLRFIDRRDQWNPAPVLEYSRFAGLLTKFCVTTCDTTLPYGYASLDSLSRTFLKIPKNDQISLEEKQNMLQTFHQRPQDTYGYAIVDALNTLLVHEQMRAKDQTIYRQFGFDDAEIPPMKATLGSRVSTFVTKTTLKSAANGQVPPSQRQLEHLMMQGGLHLFEDHPEASRFGRQTGGTHGGLLYSRSPTKFWHESPGMLRDVDMSGCYNNIVGRLNVYWGRPVIFEPGAKKWKLHDAVAFVQANAPDDGWLIRVTGKVQGFPNALLPSSEEALTVENYVERLNRGKRKQARQKLFRMEAERDPNSVRKCKGSKLYSRSIESAVVTQQTWRMIQALPQPMRREYEDLFADSIVFYPGKLVASNWKEFQKLSEDYSSCELPWQSTIDLKAMALVKTERIDAAYASLKYPIGGYAQQIGKCRKEAQQSEGKGSGSDLAWKVHANAMYGILASPHKETNNFMAANQITAWARAEAFALSQAVNAIQTITDGCTYRLDQIPGCTYRECLKIKPDYPIHRADEGDGIPFVDPATIPSDDAGFTAWYREHVKRFFEVSDEEFIDFIGTHGLEHKRTSVTKSVAFDALACDGSGNYAKGVLDKNRTWRIEDFAARSYRHESKAVLTSWLLPTYSQDLMQELAPITEDRELLSLSRAAQKARQVLQTGVPKVYFPLGLDDRKVLHYRALKPSAFIFQCPAQRAAMLKQWLKFEDSWGTGLDLLTLRRGYRDRRRGSLQDLAKALYALIRRGDTSLKGLNISKLTKPVEKLAIRRFHALQARKGQAHERLQSMIDIRKLDPRTLATGWIVDTTDVTEVAAGLV